LVRITEAEPAGQHFKPNRVGLILPLASHILPYSDILRRLSLTGGWFASDPVCPLSLKLAVKEEVK